MDELNTVLEECRDESKQKEQDEVNKQNISIKKYDKVQGICDLLTSRTNC